MKRVCINILLPHKHTNTTMSPKYDNVIVFGPTGQVGGLVALAAHTHGAKVWLAMRDPSKPIPEITSHVETSGNFARIQADLSDADSVAHAIATSSAKAAYLYLIQGNTNPQPAIQALRDGGVEHVVFLSSYSLQVEGEGLRQIPKEDQIPYAHAKVEIAIEEIGFPSFVALRPAQFASNHMRLALNRGLKPPKATVVDESIVGDNIAPEDIGAVGGAVLVNPPQPAQAEARGKTTIPLCGPELRTKKEDWEMIKKVTGREDIDATPITGDEFVKNLMGNGVPRAVAEYVLKAQDEMKESYKEELWREAVRNVERYAGRPAMKFEAYLEKHKAEWQAV